MVSENCPVSVLIPTRNEEKNLERCLNALAGWTDDLVVVDSQSNDSTLSIAAAHGARVIQYRYSGGWPKKRQWAMDNLEWKNEWILLLDADEVLTPEIKAEIPLAIQDRRYNGYWIKFRVFFLGRELRHGGTTLCKLCLFRRGKARYEIRLHDQDLSMSDIEVHEHIKLEGSAGHLSKCILHENVNSLYQYIAKHNEYSNWESSLFYNGAGGEIEVSLFANQANRRRYLKNKFLKLPGSPLMFFLLRYLIQLGFLDGKQGFIYSAMMAIQHFHVKIKLYEKKDAENRDIRCQHIKH